MLTITFDKSLLNPRPLSALIRKVSDKYIKKRLQFMYADCVNKIYELAATTLLRYKNNTARKINHYRLCYW